MDQLPIRRIYPVPLEPVSSNNIYSTSRSGHRYMPQWAKDWKAEFKQFLEVADSFQGGKAKFNLETPPALCISAIYAPLRSKLFHKHAGRKRIDLTGFFKISEDCLAEHLGIDDRQNWEFHGGLRIAESIGSSYPFMFFLVQEITLDPGFAQFYEPFYGGKLFTLWDSVGIPR